MYKQTIAIVLTLGLLYSTGLPAAQADDAAIREALARVLPAAGSAIIEPSGLPGLRSVILGTQVIYVSDDGSYVLGGPLIDTRSGSNLTEKRVARVRQRVLDASADLRVFRYPAAEPRHRVTVFTDIDCPYCRRLHNDLPSFGDAGIDVTYVMLPRAGKGSPSYRKTVSASCAPSPEQAITAAMNGGAPEPASCKNPVDAHMALARQMNITSTPSIVLEDGRLVLGYKNAQTLLALIAAGQ